jgi:TPR repeat protein
MADNSYLKDFVLLRNDLSKVPVVREAATRGDLDAQYTMGLIYAEGRGVEVDLAMSHYWLSLAVAQCNRDAEQLRNVVGSQMTDAEYELPQRLRAAGPVHTSDCWH